MQLEKAVPRAVKAPVAANARDEVQKASQLPSSSLQGQGNSLEKNQELPVDGFLTHKKSQEPQLMAFHDLTTCEKYDSILGSVDSLLATHFRQTLGIPQRTGGGAQEAISPSDDREALTPGNGTDAHRKKKAREEWERHLAHSYGKKRRPTVDPLADASIREVIQFGEEYTAKISEAILTVDDDTIEDTNSKERQAILEIGTPAETRFTVQHVCSKAERLLIQLINRCIVGYNHFNQCQRAKATSEDMDLKCSERVQSVIQALHRSKATCLDLLAEDSWIGRVVHAPIAILKMRREQKHEDDVRTAEQERKKLASRAALRPPIQSPQAVAPRHQARNQTMHSLQSAVSHQAAYKPQQLTPLSSSAHTPRNQDRKSMVSANEAAKTQQQKPVTFVQASTGGQGTQRPKKAEANVESAHSTGTAQEEKQVPVGRKRKGTQEDFNTSTEAKRQKEAISGRQAAREQAQETGPTDKRFNESPAYTTCPESPVSRNSPTLSARAPPVRTPDALYTDNLHTSWKPYASPPVRHHQQGFMCQKMDSLLTIWLLGLS
jgi:hypothetical protein